MLKNNHKDLFLMQPQTEHISILGQIILSFGKAYNSFLTAEGVYLVILYACHRMIFCSPKKSVKLLNQVSNHSYLMYLIHVPFCLCLVRPLFGNLLKFNVNSLFMIILGGTYCIVIFELARMLSWSIN